MSLLRDYKGPKYKELFKPTLDVLKFLGGSGRINEIYDRIIKYLNIPDVIVDYPHGFTGSKTELQYQLAWARTELKHLDLVMNTKKGVWVLTQKAQNTEWENNILLDIYKKYRKKQRELKKNIVSESISEEIEEEEILEHVREEDEEGNGISWRENLKSILLSLNPYDFEKLTQIILRESGFTEVEITKKSGDGGLDGKGILRLNDLISVPVIFECKRYKDPVGAEKVRNFRGAMVGRADKGLFVTTSTFTRGAWEEATREGAALIDLIDGEQLIDIIKNLGLGVEVKLVEKVEIDEDWFKNF